MLHDPPLNDKFYYVDLSSDPLFGSYISIKPEGLAFDYAIKAVGNISFQISFSATDFEGNTIVSGHDFIGPYRSYWRFRFGNVAIMAGVIVSVLGTWGDDYMSVAGKTWEHYPERWQYPFDGRPSHVNDFQFPNSFEGNESVASGSPTPTGLVYQAYQRDIIKICDDILTVVSGVTNRLTIDFSSLDSGLAGPQTNYQIAINDSTTMFDFINTMAALSTGFDWWISWDVAFKWAAPYRYGSPHTPTYYDTLTDPNLVNLLGFQNDGPVATHVLGEGAGLATDLARGYGYDANQLIYTRLDENVSFGDVRNVAQLINLTQKRLALDLQPVHTIPLTIDPWNYTGGDPATFWSTYRVGRAIFIDVDLTFHQIDSGQQVVGFKSNEDATDGNLLVDLTLSEIYDLSVTAGTPEG